MTAGFVGHVDHQADAKAGPLLQRAPIKRSLVQELMNQTCWIVKWHNDAVAVCCQAELSGSL